MTVVVAHHTSTTSRLVLQVAAKEASLRSTSLSVLHIAEAVDIDILAAQEKRIRTEITVALQEVALSDVDWTLRVDSKVDVAETILDLVADTGADLLVIGARRRSPVGKMLLGSVTQTILLKSQTPVLVVKAPART